MIVALYFRIHAHVHMLMFAYAHMSMSGRQRFSSSGSGGWRGGRGVGDQCNRRINIICGGGHCVVVV